jgi:nucleoside-diphosphate-sugar epimerase
LIEGFIKLFFTEKVHQPINLGNPTPINMLELANEVIALTGSKSKIEMRPLPGDDPKQREPLIEKAENLLGWKPVIDRQTGLKRTIEYFSSTLG